MTGYQPVAVVVGMVLLAAGALVLVGDSCPTPAESFLALVLLALGAGITMFGLLNSFGLNVGVSGMSGVGGGAVLLLFFLVRPPSLKEIGCEPEKTRVVVRVSELSENGRRVSGAKVYFVGNQTEEVVTNSVGEAVLEFSRMRFGEDLAIGVSQDSVAGWTVPEAVGTRLQSQSTAIAVVLQRPPESPAPPSAPRPCCSPVIPVSSEYLCCLTRERSEVRKCVPGSIRQALELMRCSDGVVDNDPDDKKIESCVKYLSNRASPMTVVAKSWQADYRAGRCR